MNGCEEKAGNVGNVLAPEDTSMEDKISLFYT
jgi:hypothetical protein